MKHSKSILIVAAIGLLPLGACSELKGSSAADAAACAASLVEVGVVNPSSIASTAATNVSCLALSKDLLDLAISQAQIKTAKARTALGR